MQEFLVQNIGKNSLKNNLTETFMLFQIIIKFHPILH
jgi:hypothetical protein